MQTDTQILNWIQTEVQESTNEWLALTFRVGGTFSNGFGLQQSPWRQPEKIKTALAWTISAARRRLKGKNLRFCGYLGGDDLADVFPHIHALMEVPFGNTSKEIIEVLRPYWQQMIERKFIRNLKSSVYQDSVISSSNYLHYIARYEGETFGSGDSKLVLNRSFLF